jgi:hypothetical protein
MIDILPDDVLPEISDLYVAEADEDGKYEEWQMLVHVCQKWRYVGFRSQLRLNLRILCCEGEAGSLATVAYNYRAICPLNFGVRRR